MPLARDLSAVNDHLVLAARQPGSWIAHIDDVTQLVVAVLWHLQSFQRIDTPLLSISTIPPYFQRWHPVMSALKPRQKSSFSFRLIPSSRSCCLPMANTVAAHPYASQLFSLLLFLVKFSFSSSTSSFTQSFIQPRMGLVIYQRMALIFCPPALPTPLLSACWKYQHELPHLVFQVYSFEQNPLLLFSGLGGDSALAICHQKTSSSTSWSWKLCCPGEHANLLWFFLHR